MNYHCDLCQLEFGSFEDYRLHHLYPGNDPILDAAGESFKSATSQAEPYHEP